MNGAKRVHVGDSSVAAVTRVFVVVHVVVVVW